MKKGSLHISACSQGAAEKAKGQRSALAKASRAQSITTLSGGERAIITIILLSSCYKLAGFPFVLLDEWDCFMDAGRRERALNLLLRVCKEANLQAILVSPNAVTLPEEEDEEDMTFKDMVQVITMKPPKRHVR